MYKTTVVNINTCSVNLNTQTTTSMYTCTCMAYSIFANRICLPSFHTRFGKHPHYNSVKYVSVCPMTNSWLAHARFPSPAFSPTPRMHKQLSGHSIGTTGGPRNVHSCWQLSLRFINWGFICGRGPMASLAAHAPLRSDQRPVAGSHHYLRRTSPTDKAYISVRLCEGVASSAAACGEGKGLLSRMHCLMTLWARHVWNRSPSRAKDIMHHAYVSKCNEIVRRCKFVTSIFMYVNQKQY